MAPTGQGRRGWRHATCASAAGHTEIVTKLLAANANVNRATGNGLTPLYVACGQGHAEIVTKLLAANANVDQADEDGTTPLIVACMEGHSAIVTMLIGAGSDVDKVDTDHDFPQTPLIAACRNGHAAIVTILIAANANVNQANESGNTPLHIACSRGHAREAARRRHRDEHGLLWLHAVAQGREEGRLGCVQLLSYGASRTFPFATGATAAATEWGHNDIAAWLARPATGRRSTTRGPHARARAALLRAGADPGVAAGPGGPTPPSLAQELAAAARAKARRRSSSRGGGAVEPQDAQVLRRGARVRARSFCTISCGEAAYEADGVRFDYTPGRSPTSSRTRDPHRSRVTTSRRLQEAAPPPPRRSGRIAGRKALRSCGP